jgi:hypothetical protein
MKTKEKIQQEFVPTEALSHAIRHCSYLHERWKDEEDYEDFNEYRKSMRANLPPGSSLMRMTQRPFRVLFTCDGFKFVMLAMGNKVTITRTEK